MRIVVASLPTTVIGLTPHSSSSPSSRCCFVHARARAEEGQRQQQQQQCVSSSQLQSVNAPILWTSSSKSVGSKDLKRISRSRDDAGGMMVRCEAETKQERMTVKRRETMMITPIGFAGATLSWLPWSVATGATAGLPPTEPPKLCDGDCEKDLENIPTTTTASGLQYKDIVVGNGPSPPVGFQVAAHYVFMTPSGKVFDSSLEKGVPYIFRVGASQVIKGLDEGILSMKVGGKRRLYIPGELAFPKGLGAAAGRPRVPPSSPVVLDVNLLYIPGVSGFDDE